MLFADDWLVISGGASWQEGFLLPLLLLRVLGVPFSWKKLTTGFVVNWLGLEVNLSEWRLGLSARRAAWVDSWMDETINKQHVTISELRQAVGRLQFAYSVIVWDRPFLAAFYAVISLHPPDAIVKLPAFLTTVLSWLRERLAARRTVPCGRAGGDPAPLFRVDAKADGNDVVIGGWEPHCDENGAPCTQKSRWFAIRLTPQSAPWAFWRGEPYKAISALELLGTVICLMLFKAKRTEGQKIMTVTGLTDSMVASMVLGKGLATAFPLCLIAMEAAAQMEEQRLDLALQWVPRDVNAEADALSNMRFQGFSPALRVEAEMDELPFLVLPRLLEDAKSFMNSKTATVLRPRGRTGMKVHLAPAKRLRVSQPW